MTGERWQRVKDVFHAALELPAADRAAFLSSRCAGDADLRLEIESLMTSDERLGNFLQNSALQDAAALLTDDPVEPMEGRRIGPYRLLRELGRGGMGVVYLAERDDDQYRKTVAIKLLKRGMDTDFILRRFRHERQILAELDHPNIARLLDGGTTDDGLPYFVMEFIDGKPLDEYCDAHQSSVERRLELFRGICSAVSYAHQRSIVHRDLKPTNILVTPDGTPKLLDFGIAKLLTGEPSDTADLTGSVITIMTPDYASPEQVRKEQITAASDIYSLGVVLYELLTGHRPYRLKNLGAAEVARIICEEEPTWPSEVIARTEEVTAATGMPSRITPESVSIARADEPSRLRRRLRGDLDHIVMKALRREPPKRYQTVERFSEDIRRYLSALPVEARGDAHLYRMRKFLRRRQRPLIAATAVLLLNAGGLVLWRQYTGGSEPAHSVAVLPMTTSGAGAGDSLAEGLTEALTNELSQVKGLRVISPATMMRFHNSDRPLPQIARELRVDTLVQGAIASRGNQLEVAIKAIDGDTQELRWTRRYIQKIRDAPAVHSEIARDILREVRVKLSPAERSRLSSVRTVSREAYEAYLRGRHYINKGSPGWSKAVDYFNQAVKADPDYAPAYAGLAEAYLLSANQPAEEMRPKAKEAALKSLGLDQNLPEAHLSLALVKFYGDWDWPGAFAEFERAIELNPGDASIHNWYGWCLMSLGYGEESLAEFKLALELDPLSLDVNRDLGAYYYFTRQYDAGLEQLLKTLELDPGYNRVHVWLMMTYRAMKRYDEAFAELEKIKPDMGVSYLTELCYIHALAGHEAEARRLLAQIKAQLPANYPNPYTFIYLELGDRDLAMDALEAAAAKREVWLPSIGVEPALEGLRDHPRFQRLVGQMGLPNVSLGAR